MEQLCGAVIAGLAAGIILANTGVIAEEWVNEALTIGAVVATCTLTLRTVRRWLDQLTPPPSTPRSQDACACGAEGRADRAEQDLAREQEAHQVTHDDFAALADDYNQLVQRTMQGRADRFTQRGPAQERRRLTTADLAVPSSPDALAPGAPTP